MIKNKVEMAKVKEFEINMVCYNLDNKYTLEEINEMLVDWAESKDIYLGGSIKDCAEEESSDENAALTLHDVTISLRCKESYIENGITYIKAGESYPFISRNKELVIIKDETNQFDEYNISYFEQ